ncbi:MAG: DUF2182 domain-containing protein [bacterium]
MEERRKNRPSLRFIDQLSIAVPAVIAVALSWVYLVDMAADMSAHMAVPMDMNMDMDDPASATWSLREFVQIFLMWAIMMVAMMVPTAVRTLMIFARLPGNGAARANGFLAGYIIAWAGFSLIATLLQWQLDRLRLLSPMMFSTNAILGASLLLLAALYQFSPLKKACLKHCQAPAFFLSQHLRSGVAGAVGMGVHHGAYCIGCCWSLMLLLFVAGVMDLLWILVITLFVLMEKSLPLLLGQHSAKGQTGLNLMLLVIAVAFIAIHFPT